MDKQDSSPLLIGVCADVTQQGLHAFHQAGDKYLRALSTVSSRVVPVIIPAFFHELPADAQTYLLAQLDGLLLTGAYSNLHPSYYKQSPRADDDASHDPHRDASNWVLLERAMAAKLPILGICRGFQELNVLFGGSLHHRVHEVDGLMDHREDKSQPLDDQYAPAHAVRLMAGGYLADWFAPQQRIEVNSIHMQGIDRLGDGLRIEALAEDGLVEAFSLADYPFLLAVQWHPEWKPQQYPQNARILRGFIDACTAHRAKGSHP